MCGSNCSLPTPSPIHTPSIAILACYCLGPDTEKVGDLNKRGKIFSCDVDGNVFVLLFGHNSASQAKIFVFHLKYFQGGIF